MIYRTPAILVLGHLARFGFVGVLLGRWLARQEPAQLGELRRIDGAENLSGVVRATWPRLVAAALATIGVVSVLSLSEIPVTARLAPPGFDAVAASILNAMHYQRPDVVVVALLAFVALALLTAVGVTTIWLIMRASVLHAAAAALLLTVAAGGCGSIDPLDPPPLRSHLVFGAAGSFPGQFNYPRGIAVDREREFVYVVDKNAHVQRFSFEGEPVGGWRMPAWELGKPTGLNVGPDGRVFVADTHYFRVIAYDATGREDLRFGSYGEDEGQFIYPTDVEFGPEGTLYVSEYGGNDRVQVFDAHGGFLFGFGSFGSGDGQFNRPQSMVFNPKRTELFIADACNHRIVVVNPRGRLLRTFGGAGRGAGQLLYPYDLTLLDDGTLLVCEFGNNRIQRLSRAGASLGLRGGLGAGAGQLRYPWGVDVSEDDVFVLDSGNHRVQVVRKPL